MRMGRPCVETLYVELYKQHIIGIRFGWDRPGNWDDLWPATARGEQQIIVSSSSNDVIIWPVGPDFGAKNYTIFDKSSFVDKLNAIFFIFIILFIICLRRCPSEINERQEKLLSIKHEVNTCEDLKNRRHSCKIKASKQINNHNSTRNNNRLKRKTKTK